MYLLDFWLCKSNEKPNKHSPAFLACKLYKNERLRVSVFHSHDHSQQHKREIFQMISCLRWSQTIRSAAIILQTTFLTTKFTIAELVSRDWRVQLWNGLLQMHVELHPLLITVLSTRNGKEKHHIYCSSILPLKSGSQILRSYFNY